MPGSRSRIWFALFVLAVFCLGAAGGFILGTRGFARGRIGGPPPFARGFGPGPGLPPPAAARLAGELNLDETQRAQFRRILEDHRAKFERVHRDARDRFDGEQRELFTAIRAILRPEQSQRFDQFISGRRP